MISLTMLNPSIHRQLQIDGGRFRLIGSGCAGSNPNAGRHTSAEDAVPLLRIDGLTEDALNVEIRVLHRTPETCEVELTNRGRSLALESGPRIHRGRKTGLPLPLSFCLGSTQFQITDPGTHHAADRGLKLFSESAVGELARKESPGPETLTAWLDTLRDLQQMPAGSNALFALAAQSVFNPGGLDGCLVLRKQGAEWTIAASHVPYPDHGICFREDLVTAVATTGQACFHDAAVLDQDSQVNDLHTAVVCPVLDPANQVNVVVYGFRSLHRRNHRKGIRFLEAQFVQVVADSLSAGLSRLASESEATRAQVLLEQAFSPRVAQQLHVSADILVPTSQEVTVMFVDLQGFSAIAERIGATETFGLLADTMDCFSQAINDLDGVIIDFYGDGIAAFWNAPVPQPEHAALACQAAVEILESIPGLNQRWADRIGAELQIGIGIHTGVASVGNSGSRNRLKYGPRGTTVNLASRLENLTRQLTYGNILISGETAQRVLGMFPTQALATTSLRGHRSGLEIHALLSPDQEAHAAECDWIAQPPALQLKN